MPQNDVNKFLKPLLFICKCLIFDDTLGNMTSGNIQICFIVYHHIHIINQYYEKDYVIQIGSGHICAVCRSGALGFV